MVKIVVDSSSIISLAMNCLLWVYDELKNKNIEFLVPTSVRNEVINSGLESQKYKYEALRVMHHFANGTFKAISVEDKELVSKLIHYANSSFYIQNKPLKVLQEADVEVAVVAKQIGAKAILTDERTLRMFLENPENIKEMLKERYKSEIKVNENALLKFKELIGSIFVLRSTEIIAFALEEGIFDPTINRCNLESNINCKKEIIEGILYSLKFSGCAVSFDEISQYIPLILERMHK